MARQRRLLPWLAIVVAVAPLLARQEQDPTTIWPGRDWQTATPESQGMDSGVLAEMLELVRARHPRRAPRAAPEQEREIAASSAASVSS